MVQGSETQWRAADAPERTLDRSDRCEAVLQTSDGNGLDLLDIVSLGASHGMP